MYIELSKNNFSSAGELVDENNRRLCDFTAQKLDERISSSQTKLNSSQLKERTISESLVKLTIQMKSLVDFAQNVSLKCSIQLEKSTVVTSGKFESPSRDCSSFRDGILKCSSECYSLSKMIENINAFMSTKQLNDEKSSEKKQQILLSRLDRLEKEVGQYREDLLHLQDRTSR